MKVNKHKQRDRHINKYTNKHTHYTNIYTPTHIHNYKNKHGQKDIYSYTDTQNTNNYGYKHKHIPNLMQTEINSNNKRTTLTHREHYM